MTFQRARSEEQREIRRRAILDTATEMLAESSVNELTLNALSRRVGLAKSAMLRYFESREAVLMELLDVAQRRWVDELIAELPAPHGSATERGDRFAALVSQSLQRNTVFCELIAVQPGVLEHNLSVEALLAFKRSIHDSISALTEALGRYLPELGEETRNVCMTAALVAGALWTYAHPAPNAVIACQTDPDLAYMNLDFAVSLEATLARLIAGTLVKHS